MPKNWFLKHRHGKLQIFDMYMIAPVKDGSPLSSETRADLKTGSLSFNGRLYYYLHKVFASQLHEK